MLVKKIYDASDMMEEFKAMNRDYFSYEGYEALLNLFNEFEEPEELDVIGICCDFTESTPAEIAQDYGYTFEGMTWEEASEVMDSDELMDAFIDELNYHTFATVLSNGNILYQNY